MCPERFSRRRSSKLELGVSLNCLGVVRVRNGGNEQRGTIPIGRFDIIVRVGSDATGDLDLDVNVLTQRLGERRYITRSR